MGRRQSAALVILTGLATVALSMALTRRTVDAFKTEPSCSGCPYPGGKMIAFELARSREEVLGVLGPADTPCGVCTRNVLAAQVRVDFGFLLAYSTFNAAIFLFLAPPALATPSPKHRRLARILVGLGLAASLAMLLGDLVENLALLRLAGPAPGFASALGLLVPATRIKWLALPLACLLLAALYVLAHLRFGPGRLLIALAIPYLGAAFYGALALTGSGPGRDARYGQLIGQLVIPWLASLVHATAWLLLSWRSRSTRPS